MLLRLCQLYRYPASAYASGGMWRPKIVLARILGFFISLFVPRTGSNEEMMMLMDKCAAKYPFDEAKTVVEPAFYKGRVSRLMPRSYYEPAKEMPFEDGTILVPAKVECLLELTFGDYMEPPPPEHRIPEHTMRRAYNHV